MRAIVALLPALAILVSPRPVAAQNPCEEIGSDCRVMTPVEIKALKERLLAVKAALPAPDPARYAYDGQTVSGTMPFVAEAGIAGAVPTCRSWPAGCFTTLNTVSLTYINKAAQQKAGSKSQDTFYNAQQALAGVVDRIELVAWLRPHPYLVDNDGGRCVDVSDPGATGVEKSATFLSWQTGEGPVDLYFVFGPRTCKEPETLNVDEPATAFAPVTSIQLQISGPQAEVAALKKKINRAAFEALLGPVVK
jgi:hypothetical protein